MAMLKPAARSLPITASWCRRFAGPGRLCDSIRPIAQRWRARTSRSDIARSRMAVFQSAPPEGRPISLKTTSIMASMRSSLLAMWRYSAIGATLSISASWRMVSASSPPASACAIAARSTRSLLRRRRGSARGIVGVAIGATPRVGWGSCPLDCVRRTHYCYISYTKQRTSFVFVVGKLRPGMQAIIQDKYGSAEVLEARDIDRPAIAEDEVLVRVRAASVHVGDWILMTGVPYVMRMGTGLSKPKNPVPGTDVAGTVEAVGAQVQSLRPGDDVFGWCSGAFAEYARAPEDQLVKKPANLTFEQAAAVGVSASTALQLLRDDAKVQPGEKVLINGASGGVGTFAVQIAKALGAEVTGVCSTKNLELVRSIGADHVIDYTQQDFRDGAERYDVILDNVGARSMADTRRALTPNGKLLSNGGGHGSGKLGRTIRAFLASMVVRQQARPSVKTQNRPDLIALKELAEAGQVTPVIGGTYPLGQTADAIGHVAAGHARGTLVIAM